jgi:hypothetical protein
LVRRLRDGDVVIITAVDRLSRDTTDLLVLARQMQGPAPGCGRWPSLWSTPRRSSCTEIGRADPAHYWSVI